MTNRMSVASATKLLYAIGVLENLTIPNTSKFEMSIWGSYHGDKEPTEKNLCGTSACALGWLSITPEGRDMGLLSIWRYHNRKYWSLEPETHVGWVSMGMEVFEINYDDCNSLFSYWMFVTRDEWCKITRDYVARRMMGSTPDEARNAVSKIHELYDDDEEDEEDDL